KSRGNNSKLVDVVRNKPKRTPPKFITRLSNAAHAAVTPGRPTPSTAAAASATPAKRGHESKKHLLLSDDDDDDHDPNHVDKDASSACTECGNNDHIADDHCQW